MNKGAGLFVLRENHSKKPFAKFHIGAKRGVLLHRFRVRRSEGGLDVGEDVAQEVEAGEILLNIFAGFATDRFEAGSDAKPAGKIEAGLGP